MNSNAANLVCFPKSITKESKYKCHILKCTIKFKNKFLIYLINSLLMLLCPARITTVMCCVKKIFVKSLVYS